MELIRNQSVDSYTCKRIFDTLTRHKLVADSEKKVDKNQLIEEAKNKKDFNDMKAILKASGWNNLNKWSCNEHDFEINFVVDANTNEVLNPTFREIYYIRPYKINCPKNISQFHNKIVFRIISPGMTNKSILKFNLMLLERDLTFLLCKYRNEFSNKNLKIQQIVRYVGIGCQENVEQYVENILKKHRRNLPILNALYKLRRFIGIKIDTIGNMINQCSNNFNNFADTLQTAQREYEIRDKEISVKLDRLAEAMEQYCAARKNLIKRF
jgi:hypothetical protein